MTLNGVMAVTLRYFSEFGKPRRSTVPTHNRADLWRYLCKSLLYVVVSVQCRRKESSRSLSHLLMSILLYHTQNLLAQFSEKKWLVGTTPSLGQPAPLEQNR